MDYGSFLRTAARGQLPPVVLIHGADPQLIDDALDATTRGLFPDPSQAAFGREVLDGYEASIEDVVAAARTLPLMTPTRLVAVRHAQGWPAKSAPLLADYAGDPNPATCLLLLADESFDARESKGQWLLRALARAAIVPLPVRRGRDLETWLTQRAATEGLQLSDEAARLLVEWVGEDTAALLGEARKAALAGGSANRAVGVTEVTAVVGEHRLSGVYDLARAIERHDRGAALKTLDRLLLTEEPMRLLAMLTTETRTAWVIHELGRRGQSPADIARMLHRCWEVEYRLKSGGEPRAELAALVIELSSEGA